MEHFIPKKGDIEQDRGQGHENKPLIYVYIYNLPSDMTRNVLVEVIDDMKWHDMI